MKFNVGARVRYRLPRGRTGEGEVTAISRPSAGGLLTTWPYEVKNLTPENDRFFLADGTAAFAADELEIIE